MIVFTILVEDEGIVYEQCYYYICVVDGDGPKQQNCSMVVAILDEAIKHFKTAHRHITTLYAKSDNASNLKNEMMIKFLTGLCVRSDPQNLDEEPLKCKGMSPSQPQDGKDLADLGVALANAKIQKVVDGGFSIDNPRNQAEALVDGDGLANCIVMLGDLVSHQDPIKKKKLPTITKLGDFKIKDNKVNVKRLSGIGAGKVVELEPLDVTAKYKAVVMNKPHQIKDGKPTKRTRNPLDKSRPTTSAGDQPHRDESKKLSMMEYFKQGHVQNYSMDQIKEYQPEIGIGAKSLLQRIDEPSFSENLLQLKSSTKLTPLDWTLKDLPVGHALSVWGGGKNKISDAARKYLTDIYMVGELSRAVPASEVYRRMQEEIDVETGLPLFNAETFCDEDQITGVWSGLGKPKPSTTTPTAAKRQATSTVPQAIAGVDFQDGSGESDQVLEQALQSMEVREQEAAFNQDTIQIQNFLDDQSDADPIVVAGENLCVIAESINLCIGKLVEKLSLEKKQSIVDEIEPNKGKGKNLVKNNRMLRKAIFSYVKTKCPYQSCGYIHR